MEFVQEAFLMRRTLPEVNHFPEDTQSITAVLPVLVLLLAPLVLAVPSKRALQVLYVPSS